MLHLEDVDKSYQVGEQQIEVLSGLNLRLEEGEYGAIMGKSGSGKSTLLNILGLLDKPSKGVYRLNDCDVTDLNDQQLSRARNLGIGFIFQSFQLLPRLNAMENIMLPLRYRKVSSKTRRELAMQMLRKVDIDDRAQHFPRELSGGQKQRVAIARALVGEPQLLLADEPTGALDEQTSQDIMQLFSDIHRKNGATLLLITHDEHIAQQCPRRFTLRNGQLL